MRDPIDHIERPVLPWRPEDRRTECGHPVSQFAPERILTRDEVVRKIKDQGKQRAAMSTCMTCASTSDRHEPWEKNPASVVERWIGHSAWRYDHESVRLLNREFRAIEALVAAHRDEFDSFVEGLAESTDLAERRAAKRRMA